MWVTSFGIAGIFNPWHIWHICIELQKAKKQIKKNKKKKQKQKTNKQNVMGRIVKTVSWRWAISICEHHDAPNNLDCLLIVELK